MSLTGTTPLTILYTASLSGQLALLPSLFTRILQEKSQAQGVSFLLDLGCSCAGESWICGATDGLGMLVAMDAMGYDAFHIGPADVLYTRPAAVQYLRTTIVTPLVAGPWDASVTRREISLNVTSPTLLQRRSGPIQFDLTVLPSLSSEMHAEFIADMSHHILRLDPGTGQGVLGRLDIAISTEAPYSRVVSHTKVALPAEIEGILPNPSILSVVEFVEGEARQAERKRTHQ